MNLIEQMNLGPNSFAMSYQNETKDTYWRMLHAHQGIELLYIHEGFGSVTLEHETFPLRAGTLFCFQPYQLHKVEVPVQSGASYIRSNITFDPRIMDPYLSPFPNLQAFLRLLWKGSLPQQVFTLAPSHLYTDILHGYSLNHIEDSAQQAEDHTLFLISVLHYLQTHVFPKNKFPAKGSERTYQHIEGMMDWVEGNYSKYFDLSKMASELHLSPYHISHMFKTYTGTTLSDYITARRIREACTLLANTAKSIQDIGLEIGGFGTPYFCQLFKKHKGMTPKAFRNVVREVYLKS
ncbi:AraC family transcriptional regulator [Paenibacillus psychroresistens]|uniref:AraC family transcriptional regulator n=1 Tax=Paenibacillus psychroresistens TaxID=1778678 RepID=A0A6B8RS39_9BACL|nr:AraC family transcriptional regulator [Paenibacillus psychroresistens]QGQ98156.1 AraC family transcriptional regulator [Paenibacillus psychroresistens]